MNNLPVIGIAGFGLEGRAVYDYFKGKAELHIFDEAPVDAIRLDAVVHRGLAIPPEIETLYKTPGIPSGKIALANPATRVTTLMDLLLARVRSHAVGVTGTKGKSTVSSLIHHILQGVGRDAELLGNIGVVDTSIIDAPVAGRVYVFELSSYQCEYLAHSPHIAVLTNLYQEHLSHHGSLEKYREAKLNIARFQAAEDVFVNGADLETAFAGRVVRPDAPTPFKTQLRGEHNQHNCALALRAVEALGVTEEEARVEIETFAPLAYRIEKVGDYRGVAFYDDSLATIPEATLASIAALGRVDTLILGGQDRGIDFDASAEAFAKSSVKTFITFPDTGARMTSRVTDRPVIPAASMEEAVRAAYAHTPPGGVVLLSNASPSFNLFKDYKDKSAQYRHWIVQLANA